MIRGPVTITPQSAINSNNQRNKLIQNGVFRDVNRHLFLALATQFLEQGLIYFKKVVQ
jgi:hypothetical protein